MHEVDGPCVFEDMSELKMCKNHIFNLESQLEAERELASKNAGYIAFLEHKIVVSSYDEYREQQNQGF